MAGTSRVNREVYARFCGRLVVKFHRPTRQTAEWTDAARALSVYGDEGGSPSAVPQDVEANLGRDGLERGFEAVVCHVVAVPRAAARSARSGTRKRLLLAPVAGEPTVGLNIPGH
jgi:hypothetical protein